VVPGGPFALRVPVLMYHRIMPRALAGDSLPSLVVAPQLFAAQLAALQAAGWRTITLAQLATDLGAGVRPPPRTFVITIDDGHSDGFTYALPLLLRYGDVATYFIVTGRLGEPGNLTSDQVRQLAAAGMEIGDHTVSHVDLPSRPLAIAQEQITTAAETIRQLTGQRPTSLAYPYGSVNRSVVDLVRRAGFSMAVTTRECAYESSANALVVPRVRVGPGTTPGQLVGMLSRFAAARP